MSNNADAKSIARQMAECLERIASAHDRAAFEVLFRHFAPRVKAFLLRGNPDQAAAEEIMQETMVQVWRKAAQFDPSKASASTWIFTIARNLRIDVYRRENRPEIDPNDPALIPEPELEPDAWVAGQQAASHIKVAIAELSPAEQTVLQLAYFEDKTQRAIAAQLGIPLGTVKSRLRLAFGKLRIALSQTIGDPS